MKKILTALILFLSTLSANIEVAVTYPYLKEIVQKIGKDRVKVTVLGSAKYDPHFVLPKPSLIGRLSRADMVVINGGGLEAGWLPPLFKRANNPKIVPGSLGFVDVSRAIDMMDKEEATRAKGDVHPEGNPHFSLDPHNILHIAKLIEERLMELDPANSESYEKNLKAFTKEWRDFLERFDEKMASCKGKKVVTYHKLYDYFLKRYKIESVGTIEPIPGISPSSKYLIELLNKMKKEGVRLILQDTYHEKRSAKFLATRSGAKVVVLPHDIGAVKEADSLEKLFETYAERLCR